MRGVVTISSTFGAGGGIVGPAVAERLGLPFLDRAIPVEVATRLAVSLDAVLAHDGRAETGMERFLATMARLVVPMGPEPPPPDVVYAPDTYREETEAVLRRTADTTGGVILGRAGMVVVGSRPDALCVRLDGPVEARIAQVVRLEGMSEEAARAAQVHTDRAREAYIKTLYGVHQDDPRHYHLILDSTVLDFGTCADLIEGAARARLGLQPTAPGQG
ncbi:MAG: AAA family ATPase [Acidimicrobiales bacterium]